MTVRARKLTQKKYHLNRALIDNNPWPTLTKKSNKELTFSILKSGYVANIKEFPGERFRLLMVLMKMQY